MKNKILLAFLICAVVTGIPGVPGRLSEVWAEEGQQYTNDDWNYETSTLKVNVELKETDYTKYWVAHVQTFSTRQLKSALCGGTYGNPRKKTSEELVDHDGIIGINGSGFSYGTGIPAPGRRKDL